MMRQPQARPDPLLADSLVSGVAVGSVTSVVLALLSRSKGRRPAEPIGWTSHWYRGEDMNRRRAVSPSYVLLGLVTHLAASVLWGAVYQLVRRTRRDRPAALDALGVSAVAALVDYGMVPRRLTPGWENALGPAAITAVYASMALALLATSADPKAGAGLT